MKTTKKAIWLSALSLVLCFAMLAGTTFAWFTDTVTSTGNKIQAGTLDIDLYQYVGNDYQEITNTTAPIFGAGSIAQNNNAETLWEPGKTQVAYLKLVNNGNLALKYSVEIMVYNDAKDLYKVMQYAIVPDAEPGDVNTWDSTAGNSVVVGGQRTTAVDVPMTPGAEHYFALAIHMDEAAGNEYQDGAVSFDLNVLATQYTYESDSFDNQYDAMADASPDNTYFFEKQSASAPVVANQETVLETPKATVTVPAAGATVNNVPLSDDDTLTLTVEPGDADATLVIEEGNGTTTYEVNLTNQEGIKVVANEGIKVELNIGVVDLQNFYHNTTALTKVASAAAVDTLNEYYYDETTGIVTFITDSFSPFTSKYKFAGGIGTAAYPYLIDDAAKMQAITGEYDSQYAYYKWIGASTLDASNWTAININGSFDGNGVTFNNLNQQLFRTAGTTENLAFTLENFTVNANININGYGAAIIRQATSYMTLKNVTVHGRIEGNNGAASFVCFGPGNVLDGSASAWPMQWKFINCVSDATIVATGDQGVGFVKHPYCWASQSGGSAAAQAACLLTIEDSIFTGEIIAAGTSQYKAKYFVGNANDMLVKTIYSAEFIDQYGNPEGVSYAAPTAKTADGIFFIGNYAGEGKKISGYSDYGTCVDKFLSSTASIAATTGTNPAKYSVFTVNKLANAAKAKVTLEIAPNDSNNHGAYLGTYMSEDIALTGAGSSFTTDTIKYFDITVNGNSTQESGLSADGHTYNVVSSAYGTTFASATVRVAQYDASDNVLGVTVFNIKQ